MVYPFGYPETDGKGEKVQKKKQDIENKRAEKRAQWHEARKCRKKKEISKKKN